MTQRTLEDLAEGFALFDNWEDRYRYLIDLGQRLPPMDSALKTDENLVRGCTSRVWLVAREQGGKLHFTADSDAAIVKGLIFLLFVAYQDKSAGEIAAVNIENIFRQIGLDQHLSPNRRNGFTAMVEKIRSFAPVT